jgi:Ca2+/Na+ antiporter
MPKFVTNLIKCGLLAVLVHQVLTPAITHKTSYILTDIKNPLTQALDSNIFLNYIAIIIVIAIGVYIILHIAHLIENTTSVLKDKIGVAGGLLQAVGTAFPDMIIGIVAALTALSFPADSPDRIKFAILAAAATFGSNIYNVGHAAWCVYRQNRANDLDKPIKMFVWFGHDINPMNTHTQVPKLHEIDNANALLTTLTVLTFFAAFFMVILGKQPAVDLPFLKGDLYQLNAVAGMLLIAVAVFTIFKFRKNTSAEIEEDHGNEFVGKNNFVITISLLLSGLIIFLTAQSMVLSVEHFTELSRFPLVLAGALSGLVGCLGEMVVVHNFTINPKGRIGDALVGVGMDNIVTLIGASIVAIMGGVFLGGSEIIIIFCGVLFLNTILLLQAGKLKNHYIKDEHKI